MNPWQAHSPFPNLVPRFLGCSPLQFPRFTPWYMSKLHFLLNYLENLESHGGEGHVSLLGLVSGYGFHMPPRP